MFHRTKLARLPARGALTATVALLVFCARSAGANPLFPAKLQGIVGMPCVPQCTVCHDSNQGGPGTLKKITTKSGMTGQNGFARNLMAKGMVLDGGNPDSLAPAIMIAMMQGPFDSDGDGIDDFTELKQGTDPNDFSPSATICGGPVYGCGRIAKPGPVDDVGLMAAAAVAFIGLSVTRRRLRK